MLGAPLIHNRHASVSEEIVVRKKIIPSAPMGALVPLELSAASAPRLWTNTSPVTRFHWALVAAFTRMYQVSPGLNWDESTTKPFAPMFAELKAEPPLLVLGGVPCRRKTPACPAGTFKAVRQTPRLGL